MSTLSLLDTIQQPIAGELSQFDALFRAVFTHSNPLLHSALDHLSRRLGKQMRPTLLLLCARMAGRVDERVLHGAVALELLHTASLVHDDVVDESDERRGQASVNAMMNNKAAVLVGDYLLSMALLHAAQTECTRVVTIIAQLGRTLADGELLQLNATHSSGFSEKVYYEVVRKKTAALFATCAKVGTMLAGGTDNMSERMSQFGQLVGTCFQLRDDLFDFDPEAQTGKPSGNDLREGKLTLPIINVLNRAHDERLTAIALRVRSGEASAQEIDTLVEATRTWGGLSYAEWAIKEFRLMATGLIPADAPPAIAQALKDYAQFAGERKG